MDVPLPFNHLIIQQAVTVPRFVFDTTVGGALFKAHITITILQLPYTGRVRDTVHPTIKHIG